MLAPRRYLPSTSLLAAFEAAARLGSFTLAAQELNLTQSAVSRQIKALEGQIGVELFVRDRQKVFLTTAGENYARDVREALRIIANASLMLKANPQGGTLNLAILPTFGSRWLAPRLSGFLTENPGVTVNFTTRLKPFDFAVEQLDAAIHFGEPVWMDAEAAFLMNETVIPACSPGFRERHKPEKAGDLHKVPLIHLSSRPDAWAQWFENYDASAGPVTGMVFDQFATATQAARHGLGVALLPKFLIENELASGELVPFLDLPMQSPESYYLVWPKHRAGFPPLVAFRQWIVANARG